MKNQNSILLVITLMFVTVFPGAAQKTDYGSWISVEVTKDLSKKITLEGEEEVRIFKNFGEIDRFATSFGGVASIVKGIKAGLGYTWIYDHDVKDAFWENRHRAFGYLQGKTDLGRFVLTLREKFQTTWYNKNSDNFDYSPQHYLRSKLTVNYDIKGSKLEPFLSVEMHYPLNNPEGNKIDNMRYSAGVEIPLSEKITLDTYFRLSQELNVSNPDYLYILGFNLSFNL